MLKPNRLSWIAGVVALAGSLMPASAQELVRVAVPTVDEIVKVSLIAAEEQGYFSDGKIKVEATFYRGAGACQEALAAGAADVAVSPVAGVAAAVSKGIKEKIVAIGPIVTNSGWRIFTLEGSGIKTVQDLAGKKVGISSKGSITDFYALWVQQKYGITFQSVPIAAGNLQAVKGKQLDAAVFSPILSTQMMAAGGFHAVVDFGSMKEPYVPSTFVASDDFRAKKPAAVKAFVDGLFKGVKYLKANEAYAIGVLQKVTGETNPAFLKAQYKEIILTLGEDGRADRASVETAIKLTSLAGITNPPSLNELVSPEVIK